MAYDIEYTIEKVLVVLSGLIATLHDNGALSDEELRSIMERVLMWGS